MLYAALPLTVYFGSHEVNLYARPGSRTAMVEIQVFSKSSSIRVVPAKILSHGHITSGPATMKHNILQNLITENTKLPEAVR
jgi:hypothetical protein